MAVPEHPVGKQLHAMLETWGEAIIRTASGQTLEVHTGDRPQFEEHGVIIDMPDDKHFLAYEHVERISVHRASFEGGDST